MAAGGFVALVLAASPATAQDGPDYVGGNPPTVNVPTGGADPAAGARSGGADPASASRGLPLTGGDFLGLTALGAAAIGTGTVLARRSRRSGRATRTHRATAQA